MKHFRLILSYLRPCRREFLLAVLFVTAETAFELFIPLVMANIIDLGVTRRDIPYILHQGLLMAVCALLSLICGLLYARYAARAALGFGTRIREAEYEKLQEYSFANLDHFETSSLITRMTTDVTVLQNAVINGMRPMVRGPVMLVMGLLLAFFMNVRLALVFLVCMPVLGCILFFIIRKTAPMYGRLQTAVDKVNSVVQENLNAIRAVKAYVRETYEEEHFGEANGKLTENSLRTFRIAVLNLPAFQFTMYTATVLILWFGGNLIHTGNMEVGALTGFLSYVMQIVNSLMMISNVFLMLTRSLASVSRISQVLAEEPDLADVPDGLETVENGQVEFRNVEFKYSAGAARPALSQVCLKFLPGQTIGIIGGTGSSKSTLVQLIPRLYDVSAGSVLVGGHDVREYRLASLRDAIGIVLQKNVLFSGTVRENLLWGNAQATEEELWRACRTACAHEFIEKMPGGLDARLDQGGLNLSGGQKQRLCIARTLLKHPKVMIFDDSTSAVDTATEAHIRRGLSSLGEMTKIIIAQRITSVMEADQIVILEDGRVHAVGTHESLLQTDSIYREIYDSQMRSSENVGEQNREKGGA
ncbi:MAG TPA: ABC transporter ATP-binding protein [Candidatus Scatomonas merdigallinarum]|nr:ABC transporter ATP-binding protein [Candidatus Scatomonas merdigallinarum]